MTRVGPRGQAHGFFAGLGTEVAADLMVAEKHDRAVRVVPVIIELHAAVGGCEAAVRHGEPTGSIEP